MAEARKITITIHGDKTLRVSVDGAVVEWRPGNRERVARALLFWLSAIDLSEKLELGRLNEEELLGAVERGVRRWVEESSSTPT